MKTDNRNQTHGEFANTLQKMIVDDLKCREVKSSSARARARTHTHTHTHTQARARLRTRACALPIYPSVVGLQADAMLSFCSKNLLDPEKVRPLKIFATKWHTIFGVTLATGIAAPQLLSRLVAAF